MSQFYVIFIIYAHLSLKIRNRHKSIMLKDQNVRKWIYKILEKLNTNPSNVLEN